MIGDRLHQQDVDEATVGVTGVGDPPNDRDRHLLDPDQSIEAIDGTDEAGGVAGGQLQVVGPDALVVVGISVEEDVGDLAALAALEDGLQPPLLVDLLVLGTDPAG